MVPITSSSSRPRRTRLPSGSSFGKRMSTIEAPMTITRAAVFASFSRNPRPRAMGKPAIQDVFEPGSVMKAVTMSAALEEGVAAPDTVLTVNGHIEAGDRTVQDAHDQEPINWTVTGGL